MKKIIIGLAALSAALFSLTASADKVVLTGQKPVVFQSSGDVWVPTTTTTTTFSDEPIYVTMDNTQRYCTVDATTGIGVEAGVFSFRLGDKVVQRHCYNIDQTYFTY